MPTLFVKADNTNQLVPERLNTSDLFDKICSIEYSSKSQIRKKFRVSITDTCNYNCFYCHNEGHGALSNIPAKMSVSEITKMVEIAVRSGIRSVKLTGGEPLIYNYQDSNIVDLIESITKLKRHGINFDLSLITNGQFLKSFSQKLKTAGLDRVSISLPTLNQDTFNQHIICKSGMTNVENIIDGISEAVRVGLQPIKVNTVIFHSNKNSISNLSEIPTIINKCKEIGVDELRFYTLLWHPKFTNFDNYYLYWDSKHFSFETIFNRNPIDSIEIENDLFQIVRSFAKKWSSTVYPKVRLIIKCGSLPVAFETMKKGRFKKRSPCDKCSYPDQCQEGPYAIRASADGYLTGCLLSKKRIDLLNAIRSNLNDNELIEVFKSAYSLLPR